MEDKDESLLIEQTKPEVSDEAEDAEEELLKHAVLRLNGNITGLVLGIVGGVLIFIATNWLVLKGGQDTGRHLSLLSNFYYGYSVSFVGSLIGFIYAFVTGYIFGLLVAYLYNLFADWRFPAKGNQR